MRVQQRALAPRFVRISVKVVRDALLTKIDVVVAVTKARDRRFKINIGLICTSLGAFRSIVRMTH